MTPFGASRPRGDSNPTLSPCSPGPPVGVLGRRAPYTCGLLPTLGTRLLRVYFEARPDSNRDTRLLSRPDSNPGPLGPSRSLLAGGAPPGSKRSLVRSRWRSSRHRYRVPPAGFEPAPTPPDWGAHSIEHQRLGGGTGINSPPDLRLSGASTSAHRRGPGWTRTSTPRLGSAAPACWRTDPFGPQQTPVGHCGSRGSVSASVIFPSKGSLWPVSVFPPDTTPCLHRWIRTTNHDS